MGVTTPPPWHEIQDSVLALMVGLSCVDARSSGIAEKERLCIAKFFDGHPGLSSVTGSELVRSHLDRLLLNNRHETKPCHYLERICNRSQKLALLGAFVHLAESDKPANWYEADYIFRIQFLLDVDEAWFPELRVLFDEAAGANMASAEMEDQWQRYLRVLDLKLPLSHEALRSAYRRLAKHTHPDVLMGSLGSRGAGLDWESANRKFQDLREAYEGLQYALENGLIRSEGPVQPRQIHNLPSLEAASQALWLGFATETWYSPGPSLEELWASSGFNPLQRPILVDSSPHPVTGVFVAVPEGWKIEVKEDGCLGFYDQPGRPIHWGLAVPIDADGYKRLTDIYKSAPSLSSFISESGSRYFEVLADEDKGYLHHWNDHYFIEHCLPPDDVQGRIVLARRISASVGITRPEDVSTARSDWLVALAGYIFGWLVLLVLGYAAMNGWNMPRVLEYAAMNGWNIPRMLSNRASFSIVIFAFAFVAGFALPNWELREKSSVTLDLWIYFCLDLVLLVLFLP